MEELLGLPAVTAEFDRIDALIDQLAAQPDSEISDEAIPVERDHQIDQMAVDLKLRWPWSSQQLRIGFWWRQQLVQAERRQTKEPGQLDLANIPAWPPKWTYDRRVLVVGGSPWAVINMELAPRFVMKRGDSLATLQDRWATISARVDDLFASSLFSTLLDEGPPGGARHDSVAAYERYARWAVRRVVLGEPYRRIADEELRIARSPHADEENLAVLDARERWREIKRGVRKALDVLDSI